MTNRIVRPVHFEDFSGGDFERLIFAYHLRAGWTDLAWYGQTGSDQGRDIIGNELFDDRPPRRTVIQCVNRSNLAVAKAEHDMTRAVAAPTGVPGAFKFVCRGNVSATRRDDVTKIARDLGIDTVAVWSGAEFEEHLRLTAEFLLRRFVDGQPFPDDPGELRRFVDDFPDLSDEDALCLMAAVLDRPAFSTPFREESSLPAFKQALEDSICALNTGVWRTRDGQEIRRIPSWHTLKDRRTKSAVRRVAQQIDEVRRVFQRRLADGSIRHCSCRETDCPVFFLSHEAEQELDSARSEALATFRSIHPGFAVQLP